VPFRVDPHPGRQLGRHVKDQLAVVTRRWASERPAPWQPSTAHRRRCQRSLNLRSSK
jgi:hypothetical protein